jgi:hypothetical protein
VAKAKTQTKQELKAAARTAKVERKAQRKERRGQIGQVFRLARENDRRLIPILIGVFLLTLLVIGTGFYLLFGAIFGGIMAVIAALVATAAVFSRRAQRAVFAQVEGQPGAPLGVIQGLPRGWISSDMPVAFTRDQDFVHRLLGRPGVVLIGEGNPKRVGQLLLTEKKKVQRVAADVPVYEVVVGDGPGQVPLRKLRSHLVKLPRNLKPAGVTALDKRMKALGTAGALPIPKGPIPKSARAVKRGR